MFGGSDELKDIVGAIRSLQRPERETRVAYSKSVSEGLRRWEEIITKRWCKECGCVAVLYPDEIETWDGQCYICRGWRQGIIAWILRRFGWEIHRTGIMEEP